MKKLLPFLLILISCSKQLPSISWRKAILTSALVQAPTRPDHIIYVWFENKAYSNIVGSSNAPYINSLIAKGTLFTNAHGVTHPSYPNYIAWFSGSTQGITNDNCIDGTPKIGTTIYNQLAAKGVDFRWYSEGLPSIGSTICSSGYYREKHNPTTIFSQVPTSKNRPFYLLDDALKDTVKMLAMPPVICVTPNMIDDMHDGTIQQGDAWLKLHFKPYIDWAMTHNSMLVVLFDEDNKLEGNKIPVVMIGQHVKQNFQLVGTYNLYSFTKLTCSLFGASTTWATNVNNATIPTGWEN